MTPGARSGRRVGCHTARSAPPSGVPKEREASAGVHVRVSSWSSKKSEPRLEGRSSGSRICRPPCLPNPRSRARSVASYGVRTRLQRRARAGFSPASRRSRLASLARRDPPAAVSDAGSPSIRLFGGSTAVARCLSNRPVCRSRCSDQREPTAECVSRPLRSCRLERNSASAFAGLFRHARRNQVVWVACSRPVSMHSASTRSCHDAHL